MEQAQNDLTNTDSYQIQIEGFLKEKWAEWFNGSLAASICQEPSGNRTTLLLKVPDQAALRGAVNKIWDLNLTIVSIVRQQRSTPDDPAPNKKHRLEPESSSTDHHPKQTP